MWCLSPVHPWMHHMCRVIGCVCVWGGVMFGWVCACLFVSKCVCGWAGVGQLSTNLHVCCILDGSWVGSVSSCHRLCFLTHMGECGPLTMIRPQASDLVCTGIFHGRQAWETGVPAPPPYEELSAAKNAGESGLLSAAPLTGPRAHAACLIPLDRGPVGPDANCCGRRGLGFIAGAASHRVWTGHHSDARQLSRASEQFSMCVGLV